MIHRIANFRLHKQVETKRKTENKVKWRLTYLGIKTINPLDRIFTTLASSSVGLQISACAQLGEKQGRSFVIHDHCIKMQMADRNLNWVDLPLFEKDDCMELNRSPTSHLSIAVPVI
jgi:hypothetical protein